MGMTYVRLMFKKSKESKKFTAGTFLVDSGAAYTVIPGKVLRRLGIEPDGQETFFLANGEGVKRKVGEAYFSYAGKHGTAKVIFGEEGDSNLLGALTLEALGLILDPLKRELKPLPMLMM
jgi:predicted aspartyl protease